VAGRIPLARACGLGRALASARAKPRRHAQTAVPDAAGVTGPEMQRAAFRRPGPPPSRSTWPARPVLRTNREVAASARTAGRAGLLDDERTISGPRPPGELKDHVESHHRNAALVAIVFDALITTEVETLFQVSMALTAYAPPGTVVARRRMSPRD